MQSVDSSALTELIIAGKPTELSDVHNVVLVLEYCCFVVVDIKVVWRAEYRHDTWETSRPRLSIHAVTSILRLMSADNGKQIILLQECTCCWVRKEVGTTSNVVVDKIFLRLLLTKVFQRIRPQYIAHEPMGRWFSKSVDLRDVSIMQDVSLKCTYALDILQGMQFRTQTAMNAEELLVHDSGKRERAERLHARFVYCLGVLVLAFKLEGKVIGKMATLVVAT